MASQKRSGVARNVDRVLNDRLWDDAGREWRRVEAALSRERAARLVSDPGVRVGLLVTFGPVRWVQSSKKQVVWRSQVEPEFDKPDPARLSRRRYARLGALFSASLWASGDDKVVIFAWD